MVDIDLTVCEFFFKTTLDFSQMHFPHRYMYIMRKRADIYPLFSRKNGILQISNFRHAAQNMLSGAYIPGTSQAQIFRHGYDRSFGRPMRPRLLS